jgi:AraC family transcriptional regulator of adaptative response/methylated-DNA-[protein]-cysteine methyltransferase
MSPFYLQRMFTRILGISPRAYQDALRAQRFRGDVRSGVSITDAIYDAGFGSSSRVYEKRLIGGVTPSVYRRGGRGLEMTYTIVDSALGRLLVAGTDKGITSVKLGDQDERLVQDLRTEYPGAQITHGSGFRAWVHAILQHIDGRIPTSICRST